MSRPEEVLESGRIPPAALSRVGLVVHPTRAVESPLNELRRWAGDHGVELVQVRASCEQQWVAEEGDARTCDLLVSLGGDGTTLATIRAGALAARPVLAVACGSLGVLTTVEATRLIQAIGRFRKGDWVPRPLPALEVTHKSGSRLFALNDIAIVRAGAGQLRLVVEVDGSLFAQIAGDGCIVSTPTGSSAYALAAGGPLLAPDMGAFLLTPLPAHGGSCPPLVVGAASVIRLDPRPRPGVARLEVDGQHADPPAGPLTITFRAAVATVVAFADHEPFIAVLRKRWLIADSPRILAEDSHRGASARPTGD